VPNIRKLVHDGKLGRHSSSRGSSLLGRNLAAVRAPAAVPALPAAFRRATGISASSRRQGPVATRVESIASAGFGQQHRQCLHADDRAAEERENKRNASWARLAPMASSIRGRIAVRSSRPRTVRERHGNSSPQRCQLSIPSLMRRSRSPKSTPLTKQSVRSVVRGFIIYAAVQDRFAAYGIIASRPARSSRMRKSEQFIGVQRKPAADVSLSRFLVSRSRSPCKGTIIVWHSSAANRTTRLASLPRVRRNRVASARHI